MKAMLLNHLAPMDENSEPLMLADIPRPQAVRDEVLIRISACGVCHTELDEIEGRTPPPRLPVVPGHEVIGRVIELGEKASRLAIGDRVGVGWIFESSGGDDENISDQFVATGRDVNGGYAEFMTIRERYAHRIPDCFDDYEAAPLLCAGSVGFRALKLAELTDGEVLGLTGFGGSNHLVLQMVQYLYPKSPVYVFARSVEEQQFAISLGASWAGDTGDLPPQPPHAVIDTTPAWFPVISALKCLRPGGRLVINAIRKENKDKALMATIDYADHLWKEKTLRTVANVTGDDISTFLGIAAKGGIRPDVQIYRLEEANRALRELRIGNIRGAKVLTIGDDN
jgi:propanol-preferring alcohol dehydrogenase